GRGLRRCGAPPEPARAGPPSPGRPGEGLGPDRPGPREAVDRRGPALVHVLPLVRLPERPRRLQPRPAGRPVQRRLVRWAPPGAAALPAPGGGPVLAGPGPDR